MIQSSEIYNTKESKDIKAEVKDEIKDVKKKGRPNKARPIMPLKVKKKTNERNVEQSRLQRMQEEKDKYKEKISY